MKCKLISILLLIALCLSVTASMAFASDTQTDMQITQKNGEDFILENADSICPDWVNASLVNGTAIHDLEKREIGYLFEIKKLDKSTGYIVVGNALYNYDVLEAVGGGTTPLKKHTRSKTIIVERNRMGEECRIQFSLLWISSILRGLYF